MQISIPLLASMPAKPFKLFFVYHFHTQLFRLGQLAAGLFAGDAT
jgi:hypothetical protein